MGCGVNNLHFMVGDDKVWGFYEYLPDGAFADSHCVKAFDGLWMGQDGGIWNHHEEHRTRRECV